MWCVPAFQMLYLHGCSIVPWAFDAQQLSTPISAKGEHRKRHHMPIMSWQKKKKKKKKLWKKFWKKIFWRNEIFFLKYFFYKSKFYNELKKKLKNFFLTKLKIMMLIISPKRKNTILEMALKSFILSKLDHQMSKSWKRIVAHELQTTSKFDLLKNWVSDCSAQDRLSAKRF